MGEDNNKNPTASKLFLTTDRQLFCVFLARTRNDGNMEITVAEGNGACERGTCPRTYVQSYMPEGSHGSGRSLICARYSASLALLTHHE